MSSMFATTCPLCGLRFPGRPLLDLHMRDDHPQRNRPAEPDHDDSGDAGTSGTARAAYPGAMPTWHPARPASPMRRRSQ